MTFPVRSTLAFTAGLWAVLALLTPLVEAAIAAPEARLLARINAHRTESGLVALEPSDALERVARAHALDMARRGYLDHISPEGRSPLDRTQAAGVSGFDLLAENIGASTGSGDRLDAIFTGWLASRAHLDNLENPAFNTTGLAVVTTEGGRTIVVQLFASYAR